MDPVPRWETCREDGCIGIAADGGRCLTHIAADELDSVLARMKAEGTLSAEGAVLDDELLRRLLDGFGERDERGRGVVANVQFDHANFEGPSPDFTNTVFTGRARFDRAVFRGRVSLWGSVFKHSPIFESAHFEDDALFGRPTVIAKGHEPVTHTVFERRAQFGDARFKGAAVFKGASFGLAALFDGAVFEAGINLEGARFSDRVSLAGTEIRRKPAPEATTGQTKRVVAPRPDLCELHCDHAAFAAPFSLREATLAGGA
jgi:uncharacterized protein YjbI with pentapeptide repeats